MKCKIFFLAFAIFTSHYVKSQKLNGKYTLTVDVTSLQPKPGKVFFRYYNNLVRESVTDSAEVASDKLVFKGTIDEPVLVMLSYRPKPSNGRPVMISTKNSFSFFLEP